MIRHPAPWFAVIVRGALISGFRVRLLRRATPTLIAESRSADLHDAQRADQGGSSIRTLQFLQKIRRRSEDPRFARFPFFNQTTICEIQEVAARGFIGDPMAIAMRLNGVALARMAQGMTDKLTLAMVQNSEPPKFPLRHA